MHWDSLTHEDVLEILPDRDPRGHKGDYGKILLLCGSVGYTGAASLAAMGALRCGAGLVYLAVPDAIYGIEATKLLEPVVIPLPSTNGKLSALSIEKMDELLTNMDAVLIGPGLGQSVSVLAVVEYVLSSYSGPVILDADGINVLRQHRDILRERNGITILTPHEGEFLRLGGDLQLGRAAGAFNMASDLGIILVLKGHETRITDGSSGYINHTGNPGMAVGGSGDVLAGMITALVGQGIEPLKAAACAVWLHGAAGDICAAELGQYAMLPSDILQVLPRLMK